MKPHQLKQKKSFAETAYAKRILAKKERIKKIREGKEKASENKTKTFRILLTGLLLFSQIQAIAADQVKEDVKAFLRSDISCCENNKFLKTVIDQHILRQDAPAMSLSNITTSNKIFDLSTTKNVICDLPVRGGFKDCSDGFKGPMYLPAKAQSSIVCKLKKTENSSAKTHVWVTALKTTGLFKFFPIDNVTQVLTWKRQLEEYVIPISIDGAESLETRVCKQFEDIYPPESCSLLYRKNSENCYWSIYDNFTTAIAQNSICNPWVIEDY